jgi:hypothetical protein
MEVYIGPPKVHPDVVLSRDEIIGALKGQGLVVSNAAEFPATGSLRARWVLSFEGSEISLQCQEASDGVVFATIEQSMFDRSDLPDRICRALESLGWEVDQQNVG